MISLLRKSRFTADQNESPEAVYTKHYQHIAVAEMAQPLLDTQGVVCEIGACIDFRQIEAFTHARKAIIDPYNSAPGSGHPSIPHNVPYPLALYRCLLGVDSGIIPSDHIDVSFSVSVLEHIGQEEAKFDCNPVEEPPEEQEAPRRAFCEELFRVTKPGGLTFHTIDHAARNLSWAKNFTDAGFVPVNGETATVRDCLEDPDAVRQLRHWNFHDQPMPEEYLPLHGVLLMAFKKPRWPKAAAFMASLKNRS